MCRIFPIYLKQSPLLHMSLLKCFFRHRTFEANVHICGARTGNHKKTVALSVRLCQHVEREFFSPPTAQLPVFLRWVWVTHTDLDVNSSWTIARHSAGPVEHEKKENKGGWHVGQRGWGGGVMWPIQGQNLTWCAKTFLFLSKHILACDDKHNMTLLPHHSFLSNVVSAAWSFENIMIHQGSGPHCCIVLKLCRRQCQLLLHFDWTTALPSPHYSS